MDPRGEAPCEALSLGIMRTLFQQSPRPSQGMNTSSLRAPKGMLQPCAWTVLLPSSSQGALQFHPRGIFSVYLKMPKGHLISHS